MAILRIKIILFSFILVSSLSAQDRVDIIEAKLKDLSKETLGLNDKVELSVNGVTISDFIRGLAATNNINISVDPNLSTKIVNNFSNVTVTNVLVFLCRKYNLDINFIGNILSISQYVETVKSNYVPKVLKISYDKSTNNLNLDLNGDSLVLVAKEITKVSQKNVVFSPDLVGKIVNGYIQNTPFNSALEKFAFANDLKVTATKDNFYLIEKNDVNNTVMKNMGMTNNSYLNKSQGFNLNVLYDSLVTAEVVNVPISDVLAAASRELKKEFFLFTEPKGNASLNISNSSYDDFLTFLFNGTDYTFKKQGAIYLIGDRNIEGVRSTKVVTLKYRTVDKIVDLIPVDLKKGIEVKVFRDLNSLIVSGSKPRIEELDAFLREIDRVVPVISIEVMIVDVRNSRTVSTGIKAGLGTKPTQTGGDVFPELNLNLGAGAINSIIDGINGTGVVNLGKVTPNFYVSMQLMETNGDLEIKSTPLLSTLNGNEARMAFTETKYYLENTSNVIQTLNTTTVTSQVYKPLNADFEMTVNPIVSGDEQVTLEISFKTQSFTEQTGGKNGPFGTTSREFKSLVRVKNQEMIMLGGLHEVTKDESSTGVPVLSRIPVIKWLFSSRTKKKSNNKLTIFIKPTVIY
ncbi:MAG: general secretion pathway protein GspD [Bacteroidetes bacterium]|nr:general secretion pathway protein GspD [Bacteroidota bacterium]